MPIVRIDWWAGKTQKQKARVAKAVAKAITEVLVETGMNPEDARRQIEIIFYDIDPKNWSYAESLGTPFYMQDRKKRK